VTTTTVPPVSPAALDYLDAVWLNQPSLAHVTDPEYHAWEQAWDQLCTDAEHGIAAALEAVDAIDAEVEAVVRRLRDEVKA